MEWCSDVYWHFISLGCSCYQQHPHSNKTWPVSAVSRCLYTHTHTHKCVWWQRWWWKSPPLAGGLPLPPSPSQSQSLRDAATSVQFNSSLIHVLRVNCNKLSKLFEPPTGLRLRERGGGRRDATVVKEGRVWLPGLWWREHKNQINTLCI